MYIISFHLMAENYYWLTFEWTCYRWSTENVKDLVKTVSILWKHMNSRPGSSTVMERSWEITNELPCVRVVLQFAFYWFILKIKAFWGEAQAYGHREGVNMSVNTWVDKCIWRVHSKQRGQAGKKKKKCGRISPHKRRITAKNFECGQLGDSWVMVWNDNPTI